MRSAHGTTPACSPALSPRTFAVNLLTAAAATVLLLCAARSLHAQSYNQSYNQGDDNQYGPQQTSQVDPPSRVGRLSVLQGEVSFQPASVNDFSPAELNYPLTTGDRLYTDANARAELEAGQLSLRLGPQTDFTVTGLTDQLAQFGLAQGSIHLRPFALDPGATTELDTPNASITVLQPGDVRVDVYPQNDVTIVTVFSGQVQVNAAGSQQMVRSGQSFEVSGANPAYAQFVARNRLDALDQFSAQRDALYQQQMQAQAQYVNPATIGYGDLGQYGDWNNGSDGPVWYPRGVPADWAPYRVGHWAWIAPWGWTWVESEPWGFAPFHYGRWARYGDRWGWLPGPPVVRPVYSPALVVFVGGPRFSLSIGLGGGGGVTAWFPLGPREVYQPWYHASPVYVNRVNVTNIYNRNETEVRSVYNNRTNVYDTTINRTTVNNIYVNRTVATTAVSQDKFASGRPVREAMVRVDPNQMAKAPVLPHPLVTPTREMVAPAPARALPPMVARPVLATRANESPSGAFGGPRNPQGGFQGGGNRRPASQAPLPAPTAPTASAPVNTPVNRPPDAAPRPFPTRSAQQPTDPSAGPKSPVMPGRQNGVAQQQDPRLQQQIDPSAGPKPPVIPGHQNRPVQMATPFERTRPDQPPPARPVAERPLVNQAVPPPPHPNFDQQRQAIQRSDPGRPLGPQQLDNLRNNRPAGPPTQPEPVPHPAGAPRPQPPAPAAAPEPQNQPQAPGRQGRPDRRTQPQ